MTLKDMREVREYINTNLEPLKTLWRLSPKQVWWEQYFKWFNFELKYIPGGGNLLGAKFIGSFLIVKVINPVTIQFKLPCLSVIIFDNYIWLLAKTHHSEQCVC